MARSPAELSIPAFVAIAHQAGHSLSPPPHLPPIHHRPIVAVPPPALAPTRRPRRALRYALLAARRPPNGPFAA